MCHFDFSFISYVLEIFAYKYICFDLGNIPSNQMWLKYIKGVNKFPKVTTKWQNFITL